MNNILVTGSKGQLGNEMQLIAKKNPDFDYFFTDVDELDITNIEAIENFVVDNKIDFIVNCAAYTAVDKAETDIEFCYKINAEAVKNIAEVAKKISVKVIHVSTDYVFNGENFKPYNEEDVVCPVSVYGKSKLEGEKVLFETMQEAVVIRTSWLYSSFGNNFVKTMMKLGTEREAMNVIFDQVGTPTYAADLAEAIATILKSDNFVPGIYHFSNEGVCSWYDFAIKIHQIAGIKCLVRPIESKEYHFTTPRPHYSVLNKSKIKKTYGVDIPHWEESLRKCVDILKNN
jgi:dTDP-4-dehydrorhamnose reductase